MTGARYYDPVVGRFISPEPNVDYGAFDDGAGMLAFNVYAYCANNPVNYADPSGEFIITCIVVGAIAGAIIGGSIGGYASYKKYGKVKWQWVAGGALLGGAAGALIGWGAGAVIAKVGVIATAKGITAGSGGAGFATFNKLKEFLGSAGAGKAWHHIVEQCQAVRSGFSNMWINNSNNVVSLSNSVHNKISAYYSSIDKTLSKTQTVRQWLSGQSFQKQYEFGIKVLRKFGVKI
jgi:RHS repeat-associated protein